MIQSIIQWLREIPTDILSGIISGLIVGIILLSITIYVEKRKDYYKYKSSFNVEEINEIVIKIRETTKFFDENIVLLGSVNQCFQDEILNLIIVQTEKDFNDPKRQMVIDYYELIDKWTKDALTLINASRSFPKSRKVKRNIKYLKESSWHITYIPIKDLVYANSILSEYFLNIVGNKEDNLDYEHQSKTKYNYIYLRNPKSDKEDNISTKNERLKNEEAKWHDSIYKNYDKKRAKVKANLLDEDYYFREILKKKDHKK